jgi:hypothetical protein
MPPATAHAQACAVTPEVIVTLRDSREGQYSLWDYVYGVQDMEQLADAVELPDRSILAAGTIFREGYPEEPRPLLFRIDRRDRLIWENRHEDSQDAVRIVKMFLEEDSQSVMVIGNITLRGKDRTQKKAIWTGLYDIDGKFISSSVLDDPDYDISVQDAARAVPRAGSNKDDGFVLAVLAQDRVRPSQQHGIVYGLSAEAKKLWQRSYKPGLTNRIHGITAVRNEAGVPYYVAVGSFEIDVNRSAGFIMSIDREGRLAWAEQYPRGLHAVMREVTDVTDGDFVVIGDVVPQGEDYKRSAWIMRLEAEGGDMQWERYVAVPDMRVFGRSIRGRPDGRIIAALETRRPSGSEGPELARVLSISPRGVIFQDESFLEGAGVSIGEMRFSARGQPFLIGTARQSYKADDEDNVGNYKTDDGWMIYTPSLDPYIDPCIPRRYFNE